MTRQRPRVLITGASIAGPTVAWGLVRQGFEPVLLERSSEPRTTGQNVDVRGLGREVLRRMGIERTVMDHLTGEVGTRFIDPSGRVFAEAPSRPGHDGATAEVEILRGTFADILLDQVRDDVEIRYGDFVTGVSQDDGGVTVELDRGPSERFAALVVAEGRSSRTRRLLFADSTTETDNGVNIAYGTIDRTSDDDDWWYAMTTTEGRVAMIRPDNLGSIRASLTFPSPTIGFETLPFESQLRVLHDRYDSISPLTDRILEGFEAHPDEYYSQRSSRVQVDGWHQGRVVLLGDAAWGSGPSGMGTTLSLVGGHVLAGELGPAADTTDYEAAFARYEQLIRAYVDSAQALPPGLPRLAHPQSALGVNALRMVYRIAVSKTLSRFTEKTVVTSQRHEPALADYTTLRP